MFATVHNTHLPQFMSPVPEPRALAIDAFFTGLAGEFDVHVFTVSPAQQSHSEAQDHPDRRGDTLDNTCYECGSPTILSIPQRPVVTTGLYLERQVVPSAHMEALMQHYQAAEFSREVYKLAAAATCSRPSPIECRQVATLR